MATVKSLNINCKTNNYRTTNDGNRIKKHAQCEPAKVNIEKRTATAPGAVVGYLQK